jgi:hypothetical protein
MSTQLEAKKYLFDILDTTVNYSFVGCGEVLAKGNERSYERSR